MSFTIEVNNCWDCPYRDKNTGGKVPHYCRKKHSCMCDEDFPKYCPLVQHESAKKETILDEVKAEIENIEINGHIRDVECFNAGINTALNVIDKYRAKAKNTEV